MSDISSVILILVGSALVLVILVDAIGGFFRVGPSAGLVTRPFESAVAAAVLWWVRRSGNRRQLNLLGAYCVVTRTVISVMVLWIGWTLIFISSDEALVASQSGAIAGNLERLYFAGYTVSTLGLGDFKPGNDTWRVVTTLVSLSGFMFLTFLVSFLVTISSQISERRALAMTITSAGGSPYAILERYRNGGTLDLGPLLSMIALPVIKTAEASVHLPLLHRFHAADTTGSYAIAIARLDETLTILELGCAGASPPEAALVRHGVDMIIAALPGDGWRDTQVDIPSLEPLRAAGVDCPSERRFADAVSDSNVRCRRARLKQLVESLGFSWQQHVYQDG